MSSGTPSGASALQLIFLQLPIQRPNPDSQHLGRLLAVAAERTGLGLDDSWMIGDNPDTDIGAANDAGIKSVWLRIGRSWPREDFAPTYEADTFPEAVDLVLAHG